MLEQIPNANPSPVPTRLLWSCLAFALAVAIGAGAWSLLGRKGPAEDDRQKGGTAASGMGAAGGGGAAVPAAGPSSATAHEGGSGALPDGDEAPAFSLTERSGRAVSRAELDGTVWIANFIFTRCASVCPDLTRKMAAVRRDLAKNGAVDIVSVSFSVDPVHDTPEVLSEYAESFHADRSSWLFLTGDPKEMLRIVKDGFHLMMVDPSAGPPAHSNRFVLVDAKGRMRGSHLGTDDGVVDAIVKEALALRQEARG